MYIYIHDDDDDDDDDDAVLIPESSHQSIKPRFALKYYLHNGK